MRTILNTVSEIKMGLDCGKRALVAFFEYSKANGGALTSLEIDSILQTSVDRAAELGATFSWSATVASTEPAILENNEELALQIALETVKISPDPVEQASENDPETEPENENDSDFA